VLTALAFDQHSSVASQASQLGRCGPVERQWRIANSRPAIDRSTAGATSGATRTGAPRFRTEHGDKGLLFRSRKQHAASTCKLSRAGRDFRVRVQGCAWSSVAVDVGIDVGQEVLRSRAMVGCVPARQTSDAWSGASGSVYSDQAYPRGGSQHGRSCALRAHVHPSAKHSPATSPVAALCPSEARTTLDALVGNSPRPQVRAARR
jgi:hypothetical protein